MIERQTYIDRLNSWKDKQIIKVLTGIRRCGKSTLLGMFASKLRDESAANNIISLNMEDLDNERLQNYREFYTYVKELLTDGRNYLFVDEIQMIPEFQRAIDSLQLIDNLDIYITGSNAYLLSGELSTLLSGRYVEIKIFPLSFKEFASAMPASMTREEIYSNYITFGSLPYVTRLMPNRELVRDYLEGVYNTIVVKDVVARRNISDVMMLEKS